MKAESYLCFDSSVLVKTLKAEILFEFGSGEDVVVNDCWEGAKMLEERIMTIILL